MNNNKNTSVPVTRIYLFTSAHTGEKERNSSFFTDVWFLLISGQEKTEKMDKMVSVTLWFIHRFIDLK